MYTHPQCNSRAILTPSHHIFVSLLIKKKQSMTTTFAFLLINEQSMTTTRSIDSLSIWPSQSQHPGHRKMLINTFTHDADDLLAHSFIIYLFAGTQTKPLPRPPKTENLCLFDISSKPRTSNATRCNRRATQDCEKPTRTCWLCRVRSPHPKNR